MEAALPRIATLIAGAAADLLPAIDRRARGLGAEVTPLSDGLRIAAANGVIEARAVEGGLGLTVAADEGEVLDALRGAVEQFVAASGRAAPIWQGDGPARPRLHAARVEGIRRISPSYSRVRLTGDFTPFAGGGLHFRLLLGPPGAADPVEGPAGIDWPGGIDAWHRPPYTIRAMDPAAGWIDVDIFRHAGGRVTEWCDAARPGDPVRLTGPGGRGVRPARWLGLVGDETALPVILRALEAAGPEVRGRAAILIGDPADRQAVAPPPGVTLDWVVRDGAASAIALFRALAPPEGDRFLFFAGERREAEAARTHAKALGLGAGEFHAAAYWTAGWVPPASQRQAKG